MIGVYSVNTNNFVKPLTGVTKCCVKVEKSGHTNLSENSLNYWTRLYEAQLSFNHGLKPRLISALLNRVVRSSIIF